MGEEGSGQLVGVAGLVFQDLETGERYEVNSVTTFGAESTDRAPEVTRESLVGGAPMEVTLTIDVLPADIERMMLFRQGGRYGRLRTRDKALRMISRKSIGISGTGIMWPKSWFAKAEWVPIAAKMRREWRKPKKQRKCNRMAREHLEKKLKRKANERRKAS